MTRLTVSFRAAWKVLRRAPERDSTGQPSDPWLEMIRQHEGLTDEELLARIAAIDDAHPGIPSTWQACRDTLNHLGNVANSTEWQRARLVVAFNEQPEEDKPPPWFIPTPPDRTKVRLERYKYEHHYAREPGMFDGIPLPATLEEAEALFGVLGIFGSYVNWQRAAIVHAVAAPHRMPDRVSFANMAAWDIIAAPNSGHIAALWDAWHKAVMAGKAEPTELGGPFVLPDMPWPHKPKRPPKKALTVAQKRAKRDWEFQQYYEKKHPPPEPHTEPGSFTPQPPVVYPMCSGCYRTRRGTGTPPGPETWHRYSSADRCSFGNDNMHERFHADDHRWAGVSSAEWLRRSQQENG